MFVFSLDPAAQSVPLLLSLSHSFSFPPLLLPLAPHLSSTLVDSSPGDLSTIVGKVTTAAPELEEPDRAHSSHAKRKRHLLSVAVGKAALLVLIGPA